MLGEESNGELLFNMYGVSIWDDEKVLEMGSDDGRTTLNVLIGLNATF